MKFFASAVMVAVGMAQDAALAGFAFLVRYALGLGDIAKAKEL